MPLDEQFLMCPGGPSLIGLLLHASSCRDQLSIVISLQFIFVVSRHLYDKNALRNGALEIRFSHHDSAPVGFLLSVQRLLARNHAAVISVLLSHRTCL